MNEIATRAEKHFRFSIDELLMLFATAFVAAFGLTLSKGWGVFNLIEEQTPINYVVNLLLVLIIMLIALLFHFSAQKLISLKLGYKYFYKHWTTGFVLSTFICFVTFSFIPLFFVGSASPKVEQKIRMGRFRPGIMQSDVGVIAFSGPFTSILIALFAGFIYVNNQSAFVYAFIVANLLVAIYSMLPIPTFEPSGEKPWNISGGTSGLHLFIASRWIFILVLSFVIIFSLLVMIAKVFSLVVSLILAIFVAVLYYNQYEK